MRGVNWLGDAVMTMPALQRLRERFPQAQIALLTNEKIADLWQNHPSIDELITFGTETSAWAVGSKIRALKSYDLAVVLPNSPRSALEVWLAHIPRRVGYRRPWRNWLLTQTIATRPGHIETRKLSAREIQSLIRSAASVRDHASRHTEHGRRITFSANSHQIYEYLHLLTALGSTSDRTPVKQGLIEPLSERELEVLRLLGTGLNGPEIARELVVSLNTMRTHTKNIYSKLGVNNRRAAVRRAEELDLF